MVFFGQKRVVFFVRNRSFVGNKFGFFGKFCHLGRIFFSKDMWRYLVQVGFFCVKQGDLFLVRDMGFFGMSGAFLVENGWVFGHIAGGSFCTRNHVHKIGVAKCCSIAMLACERLFCS